MSIQWNSKKAYELMTRHREHYSAHLENYPSCIDLKQARGLASAMYNIIKDEDDGKWKWPVLAKHKQGPEYYTYDLNRKEGETEESFRQRKDIKQNKKGRAEARWLRCAIIASRVLKYLATEHAKLFPTGETPPSNGIDQSLPSWFDPAEFYNYTWVCLNEGKWNYALFAQQALMPSAKDSLSPWYVEMAQEISDRVLGAWHKGIILGVCILPFRSREITPNCGPHRFPEGVPLPLPKPWVNEISRVREDIEKFLSKSS